MTTKMKRVFLCWLLVFTIFVGLMPVMGVYATGNGSLSNFKRNLTYNQGRFSDVKSSDWFVENVAAAYEFQLVNGTSATTYEPNSNITIAQTITLASRLHSIYFGDGELVFTGQYDPWYQPYVDYAVENGIIKSWEYSSASYNNFASRRRFAYIIAAALPSDALNNINHIEMGEIPDMEADNEFAPAVYLLYNAGILTGNDEYGTFLPSSYIRRSEVAAIVTRMAEPALRKAFQLQKYIQNGVFGTFYKDNGLKMTIEDASKIEDEAIRVTVEGEDPVVLSYIGEWDDGTFADVYIRNTAKNIRKGLIRHYSKQYSVGNEWRETSLECVCNNQGDIIGSGLLYTDTRPCLNNLYFVDKSYSLDFAYQILC